MGEHFEQAKKLVHNHVLWEQEMLIDGMLKAGLLPEEYIYPLVVGDTLFGKETERTGRNHP